MDNERIYLELLKRANPETGIIQDSAGNNFRLDPDTKSAIFVGGGTAGTDKTFAPSSDAYGDVLRNLLRDTEPDIRDMREGTAAVSKPFTAGPSIADLTYYPEDDPDPLPPSRYTYTDTPPPTRKEQLAAFAANEEDRKEALIAERRKAQRRDQALKLGPAAILGGLDLAVQLGAFESLKGEDEKYVDEELARLRKMQADDEMGLSAEEKKLLVQAQMAPARGLAREERMRREAGEAAMGGELSAADLERSRRAQQQTIAEVGRQSGMTLAQADLAKADQNLRRMEQMIAFKGQRQKQKRAAVSSFAGALGSIFGDVAAAGAIEPKTETVDALYAEAAKQGKLLKADEATKAMRQLQFAPRMDDAKIRKILKDIGIPNASDEFIANLRK